MSGLSRRRNQQYNQLFETSEEIFSSSDHDNAVNENFVHQNSCNSNVSTGPPIPKVAGWCDRLSGTSDTHEELQPQSMNENATTCMRAVTRNAWSDEKDKTNTTASMPESKVEIDGGSAELTPAKYRKIHDKYWSAFHNFAVADDDEPDSDASAVEQIFLGIINNIKNTEETLLEWKQQRNHIRENARSVHSEIDSRRKEVHEMVDKYAQSLHDKVAALADGRLEQAASNISGLKDTIRDMQRVAEKNFKEEKIKAMGPGLVKSKLEQLCAKFDHHNNQPLPWEDIVLDTAEKSEQLVGAFFGNLRGGNNASLLTGGLDNDSERTSIGTMLIKPQMTGTFCCKSHKDVRECGITDVAVNASNDIVVVDKHNKLVKVFDSNGVFQSFIGRKIIKEPARISILSACEQILLTDMSTKSIKIFSREGKYVGDFASDLKYPVCHCEMYDGNVAVLEYATKSVIVYDPTLRQLHSFDTNLECPAYLACTKSNHFVITDWRYNAVKIFNTIGTEIITIKGQSSEPGLFNSPQGACADRFGNVFIAEKGNKRVQVFTEDGEFVRCYDSESGNFRIPWALACNSYDLLIVAEYQGYIKLLKYLDIPYNTILSEDYQKSKMKSRKKLLSKSRHEDISETKC